MGDSEAPGDAPPSPPPAESASSPAEASPAPTSTATASVVAETVSDATAAQEPQTDTEPAKKADVAAPAAPAAASPSKSAPPAPPKSPSSAPERRRPKPPTRGILKPPPPPAKPSFGGRLRDIVGSVTGEVPGPAGHGGNAVNAAAGALNAISGRLGLGFRRFAEHAPQPPPKAHPPRTSSLPEPAAPALPAQQSHATAAPAPGRPLKRATFVLPSISITYPISSLASPWSTKVLEDRERIETRQRQLLSTASGPEYWTSMRLIKLYESACRGREEKPRLGIVRALQAIPVHPRPRLIYLVLQQPTTRQRGQPTPYPLEQPLNRYAAEALADVLAVDWALTDIRLEHGAIQGEDALKPILHALLVSGTLPSLSLAGNRRIKVGGWQLVAVFLKRARTLKFIDLSETNWDKKSVDYLVQALNSSPVAGESSNGESEEHANGSRSSTYGPFMPPAPMLKDDEEGAPAALQSLRMDSCGLRSGTLDALAHGVRTSQLRHISLRHNRIGPLAAVALAVMIRDYPDSAASSLSAVASEGLAYTPRSRRGAPEPPADDSNLPPIPVVSGTGGVTSRIVPDGYKPPPPAKNPLVMPGGGYSAMQDSAGFGLSTVTADGRSGTPDMGGASLALQRSVRALDRVERIGHLLTLDLKGNDIGRGVTYIAQVLKRNRTLRVLNLSDNKIDAAGLVAIAEALKYNSTLETLDLSSNPCCGPSLEGILALRTSFTVNNSLKRLFLSDTGLTTEGAIDLAEFIPENRSLLHLDLTDNPAVGAAGVLAVASGLKSNKLIRCLDVSIPPNDPNLAELSQSILQSCIRNTELAATATEEGGKKKKGASEAIWAPIKKSVLVRQVKEADQARAQKEREAVVSSVQGQAREYVYRLSPEALLPAADDTAKGLAAWYAAGHNAKKGHNVWDGTTMPKDDFRSLLERAKALHERISETLASSPPEDAETLERLLGINDTLTGHIASARGFMPPPRILLPSQIAFSAPAPPVVTSSSSNLGLTPRRRHRSSMSLEISSPNFSIGDSDAESDAEELDPAKIVPPKVELRVDTGIQAELREAEAETEAEALQTPERTEPQHTPEEERAAERLVDAELNQGLLSSPVERGKRWVEEEAEVFRKGTRLGVVDDEDRGGSQVSGEELRREIMKVDVPRSPPRSVVDLEPETPESNDDDD